jgi:DNA-binding transcriptional regulator YiaG
MCKHVAAVLYGVGSRLDSAPELLFLLRAVNHTELIQIDASLAVGNGSAKNTRRKRIADDSVADLFGIDMLDGPAATSTMNAVSLNEPKAMTEKVVGSRTRSDTKSIGTNSSGSKSSGSKSIGTSRSGTGTLTPAAEKTGKSVKAKDTKFTGTRLNALRQKFEMSQVQFAKLLGVSSASIGKWEKNSAILNLKADTLAVLQDISKLSKKRVWELLD